MNKNIIKTVKLMKLIFSFEEFGGKKRQSRVRSDRCKIRKKIEGEPINVTEIDGLLFLGFGPMYTLHGKLFFPVLPIK